ncbi:MAG: Undecaprenyl-phosphate 4-deoxy-4-formamido-L-arabinose transferase [Elusimicrobia bacterium]|nr:Undecaprenyl-phosphate 4-deoxy-4-formamido-L-arabinose transferase [Elusimicrobiota bacterium]
MPQSNSNPNRPLTLIEPLLDVSVVVYLDDHLENTAQTFATIANLLRDMKMTFEFIFMDDGNKAEVASDIEGVQSFVRNTKVIRLPRFYGNSTAMPVGFGHARGRLILTLGSFLQVQPEDIRKLFEKLNEGYDFVNGWRFERKDSGLNQFHTRFFNTLIRWASQVELHDTNCTLKLFRREVAEDIRIYGDLYRFFPIFAAHQGYLVTEVPVRQRKELNQVGLYSPLTYLRRGSDLLMIFFTTRFVTKPLRFFGLVGSAFFSVGFLICSYLVVWKYMYRIALAERPLLLLGVLLIIMGVQIISVGLIGELILFIQMRQFKMHRVEKILS